MRFRPDPKPAPRARDDKGVFVRMSTLERTETHRLRSDEPDPDGEPKRYKMTDGTWELRWKVGIRQYATRIERDEHGRPSRWRPFSSRWIDRTQLTELHRQGLSQPAIAEQLGCDASTVCRAMKTMGLVPNNPRHKVRTTAAILYNREFRLAKIEVHKRSGGWCEAKTEGCTGRAQHVHHRRMRSQRGSNRLTNLIDVCFACHWHIHRNPKLAYEQGWLLRAEL